MRKVRWRCRTDLLFLCNEVLGYTDVCEEVHGSVIERLQKFKKPTQEEFYLNDRFEKGQWKYLPLVAHQKLAGTRRMVYLDPRGHLKTSLNTIAHSIQFILNYPNIAIMISVANTERAKLILKEILEHFTTNEKFRRIFPEHCPDPSRADMFGRQDGFTTLARDFSYENRKVRREPTIHLGTIEKAVASLHFDVLKFSDIVDEENSQTREQCQKIIASYSAKLPAVVTPHESWVYLEGTRYHNEDLYGEVMRGEMINRSKGLPIEYDIFMRGCFKKKNPTYTLEDLDETLHPYELDEKGRLMPIFPQKFTYESLMSLKNNAISALTFNEQYLNDPTPAVDSPLPTNKVVPKYIDPEIFHSRVRIAYYEIAVDLAETTNQRSDFSAMTVMAWDFANKPYVCEIVHGKFEQQVNLLNLLRLYQKYKPDRIYIEDSAYTRGLMPSIERMFQLKNLFPSWEVLKRSRGSNDKNNRIGAAIGEWWKSGTLKFVYSDSTDADKIKRMDKFNMVRCSREAIEALRSESRLFPRGRNDDILDTLADLLMYKTYFARLGPREIDDDEVIKDGWQRMLFDPDTIKLQQQAIFGEWDSGINSTYGSM